MESFAFYLLKSTIWILGFASIYILFLQNERYFLLNRLFLILGMFCAFVFPLITWNYKIESIPEKINPRSLNSITETQINTVNEPLFSIHGIVLIIYIAGALFIVARNIWQVIPIIRSIKQYQIVQEGNVKIIQTARFQNSFSFISYVFVNPSINLTERCEIMNHEQEHIRQKHWIDLVLFELLRAIQWFNPFVWLYGQKIRQNHEYLADKHALRRSVNPGVYHATLLNQVFGGSVISLTNSFNYSFNKKRFNMMSYKYQSPTRKLKFLFILPIIAGIFYAFSEPEYTNSVTTTKIQTSDVKVGNMIWLNNTAYSSKQLGKVLGIKKGETYSEEKLDKYMYGQVSDLYLNNGYVFFNVEIRDTVKNAGVIDLTFSIYEGPQCKIGKVDVKGNDKVSTDEIMKVVTIRPGELFSKDKLNVSFHNINKTGKFVSEKTDPEVKPNPSFRTVDITFNLEEK
uniref:POTRA domain-containing protein n=1 Tax=uncultured Draconibacterium sp. TaxID=1573823 RepID=UPI003217C8A9